MAAIHLFTHSDTKSKISSSSVKKLVAATARLLHRTIYKQKKEPAVADSYMKQCDLRAYFDDMHRKHINNLRG